MRMSSRSVTIGFFVVAGVIKSSSLGHRPRPEVDATQQILLFDVDFLNGNQRLESLLHMTPTKR